MSISNYYDTGIRNDFAAMKAREERASYVGRVNFNNIVDSGMRLSDAIDSPSSPYKPAAIALFASGFFFTAAVVAAYSRNNYWY